MTEVQRDLKMFMAIAQASAVEEAKLMPTTPDIKQRARSLAGETRPGLRTPAHADERDRRTVIRIHALESSRSGARSDPDCPSAAHAAAAHERLER